MKKLMQSSDKSTYLRAEKTRLGCGLYSRISALSLKGCHKKQENFQSITNLNKLEPKSLITMKASQYGFVFFVCFVVK